MGAAAAGALVAPLVALFRFKFVHSVLILACWSRLEQVRVMREMCKRGLAATVVCDAPAAALDSIPRHGLQGVVYFTQPGDRMLHQLRSRHFCGRYVWALVGDQVPGALHRARYDAEAVLLQTGPPVDGRAGFPSTNLSSRDVIQLKDIYVHPSAGATAHPWALWTRAGAGGLRVGAGDERARVLRRRDLKGYPLRIATPVGCYSQGWYGGTFEQYLVDLRHAEVDSSIKSGFAASSLLVQALNATAVVVQTELWGATHHNSSMLLLLRFGQAELSGAIARILRDRVGELDFIVPIWPLHVGFMYVSERESSTNMFVSPFSAGVWWASAGVGAALCAALRATARSQDEREQACCTVLATWLQQDAAGVPQGVSGRWTFVVVSVCAMLVHAYYTSAIVSALMRTGGGAPGTLRALADSKYRIASEDIDFMRHLFFDVETTWEDLEYLKRKKKTADFYLEVELGVQLIRGGSTAYHTEYNKMYAHLNTFRDDEICKLQEVDTIPKRKAWLTAPPRSQFTNTFRGGGARLAELGLHQRAVSSLLSARPPCRAHLLAEQVTFGDVAPLLGLTASGAGAAVLVMGLEILIARHTRRLPCPGPLSTPILA